MLQSLYVRDFAIIDEVALEIGPGLTVLTGETGTGKSILVGALQLLLGERASADLVRIGADRSLVQGTFRLVEGHPAVSLLSRLGVPVEDQELIVRREVTVEGRSRAFLNDASVTVGALREVGETLVDLHGQHEHQSLINPATQLLLLDAYAGLDEMRETFGRARERYFERRSRLEELKRSVAEQERQMELILFQLGEIDALDPRAGEPEELEQEIRILQSAEQLARGMRALLDGLAEGEDPMMDRLAALESTASETAAIDPLLDSTVKLLAEARLALQEAAHAAGRYLDDIDLDQQRLESLRERHSAIILLTKKYGGNLEALLSRRAELQEEVARQKQASAELPELESDTEAARQEAAETALKLSKAREKAARKLEENVERELLDLAMPQALFRIDIKRHESADGWVDGPRGVSFEAGRTGIDRVEYQLKTNPGGPLLPLKRIASGGEISRIMLALKSVFGVASQVPTLIFDEIDSGIGGQTADQVGQKLSDLSRQHQVVVITHLPQIARRGGHHLVVEKDIENGASRSRICTVEGEERTRALAVLMGGDAEAETAVEHARELLGKDTEGEIDT